MLAHADVGVRAGGTRCQHSSRRKVAAAATTTHGGGDELASLRRWIESHGGFVHDALVLADPAPCGVRGVVVSRRICADELMERPLALVPKTLHMDNAEAARLVKRHLVSLVGATEDAGVLGEQVDELPQLPLVAAALELERRLGPRSEWAPYIESLPQQPACPWLLPEPQLAECIQALESQHGYSLQADSNASAGSSSSRERGRGGDGGGDMAREANRNHCSSSDDGGRGGGGGSTRGGGGPGEGQLHPWHTAAHVARSRCERLAARVMDVCGRRLGLSEEEVLWALGQVSSRSLGSGSSSGLVPFLDLLNHSPAARPPMLQLDDDDRLVMTVTNVRDGELRALEEGEELYVCYGEWASPVDAWLKFGFVPQEALASDAALRST